MSVLFKPMHQRLFAILTSFDHQSADVVAAMENTLPEAYIDLFDDPFEGIAAHINYGKIEALHRNGGFWRAIESFELSLFAENLDYNIFSLSKKVPGRLFVYLDLKNEGQTWFAEGFSVRDEQILFRRDVKSADACTELLRQVWPAFESADADRWAAQAFGTRGKAWWEQAV